MPSSPHSFPCYSSVNLDASSHLLAAHAQARTLLFFRRVEMGLGGAVIQEKKKVGVSGEERECKTETERQRERT